LYYYILLHCRGFISNDYNIEHGNRAVFKTQVGDGNYYGERRESAAQYSQIV